MRVLTRIALIIGFMTFTLLSMLSMWSVVDNQMEQHGLGYNSEIVRNHGNLVALPLLLIGLVCLILLGMMIHTDTKRGVK